MKNNLEKLVKLRRIRFKTWFSLLCELIFTQYMPHHDIKHRLANHTAIKIIAIHQQTNSKYVLFYKIDTTE